MAKSWYLLPFQNDGRSRSSACCRRLNSRTHSRDVYLRPLRSITVFIVSWLTKSCGGLIRPKHPLQSTGIPPIIRGCLM